MALLGYVPFLSTLFNRNTNPTQPALTFPPLDDLPIEILEEILNLADRNSLLNLCLLSRFFMRLIRPKLFSALFFTGLEAKKFDGFLDLLARPYSTIAPTVTSLRIRWLFRDRFYRTKRRHNIHVLGKKLVNMRLLRQHLRWEEVPEDMTIFFSSIPAQEVWIHYTDFSLRSLLAEQWKALPATMEKFHLSKNMLDDVADQTFDLASVSSVFSRPLHFTFLDAVSLGPMQLAWDPDIHPEVASSIIVKDFYLNKMTRIQAEKHLVFVERFIKHIGPTLNRLFIETSEDQHVNDEFDQIDWSTCTNLTQIHFGLVRIAFQSEASFSRIGKIASRIPSAGVEMVSLVCQALGWDEWSTARCVEKIDEFPWMPVLQQIVRFIPSIRHLKLILVGWKTDAVDSAYQRLKERVLAELCPNIAHVKIEVDIIDPHNGPGYFIDVYNEWWDFV